MILYISCLHFVSVEIYVHVHSLSITSFSPVGSFSDKSTTAMIVSVLKHTLQGKIASSSNFEMHGIWD